MAFRDHELRYWSVEEVRAYLPRLRSLLRELAGALVPGPAPGTLALPPGSEHAEAAIAELVQQGVVLRQIQTGLADFPVIGSDGGVYFLCWHVDEPDVAWWHRPEDGYAGRQPLPIP